MDIRIITPDFAVSGQITPDDVQALANGGFKGVVCNRPDGEVEGQPLATDIEAAAAANGLAFSFIPISPGIFTDEQARELSAFLAEVDGPVLAFCRSGARSGTLWERAQAIAPAAD